MHAPQRPKNVTTDPGHYPISTMPLTARQNINSTQELVGEQMHIIII